jgi:hypothetical protein
MSKKFPSGSFDVYEKCHRTPGDTSEGRWITVLFSLLGCLLCAASFLLYFNLRTMTALLIAVSVIDLIYTYIEISHLYIRKYWFRDHRRLAVLLSLLAGWMIIFALVICINCFALSLAFTWQLAWIPCFLMPPILVLVVAVYILINIIGG